MSKIHYDKYISIGEYGIRFDSKGQVFYCGEHKPYSYLKFPQCPTLKNSAAKLLWAIEFASHVLADRPTRKQTQDICKLSQPLFKFSKLYPAKVDNQGYWRDLYRRGYIRQFRRSYGRGSNRHFDVVYELTENGRSYLNLATNNQQKD